MMAARNCGVCGRPENDISWDCPKADTHAARFYNAAKMPRNVNELMELYREGAAALKTLLDLDKPGKGND